MVEIADIDDRDSLKAWLDDKPRELSMVIGARAAARAAPLYWVWAADPTSKGDLTDLLIWRAIATARVRGVYTTRAVEDAAARAAHAAHAAFVTAYTAATSVDETEVADAYAAAHAADTASLRTNHAHISVFYHAANAGASAAQAAAYAADDAASAWRSVQSDLGFFQNATDYRGVAPLWADGTPDWIETHWATIKSALLDPARNGNTDWSFWIDWYESLLEGRPQNWEMLKDIVLIPDEDWQTGAAHVNPMINAIRQRYAEAASPNAEVIELNPETGKFRAVPLSEITPDALRDGHDRLADATQILGPPNAIANQYTALQPEISLLIRALERYPDRALRLHDTAIQALRRVEAREAAGECPEAAKDPLVADFKTELLAAAGDFQRQDPKVAEVVQARAAIRLQDVRPEDVPGALAAAQDLSPALEGTLANEMVEDAEVLTDPAANAEAFAQAVYRFGSRAVRISGIVWRGIRKGASEVAGLTKDIATIVKSSAAVATVVKWVLWLFT